MATLSSDAHDDRIERALALGNDWDWAHTENVKYAQARLYHEMRAILTEAAPPNDAAILAAKADGWDEACQALAWCFDNGPERNALPYMIEHNPFSASIEQTEVQS